MTLNANTGLRLGNIGTGHVCIDSDSATEPEFWYRFILRWAQAVGTEIEITDNVYIGQPVV